MLKGHVFKQQIFGNQIFALFINTFLNGQNGISNNYKNGMAITYNGSTLTVQSGAVCIQGRFLEEDTSTDISAGTDTAYCKLVIEIDLDKQNSEEQFAQGTYKIIKGTSDYPAITQTEIVKNNSGIYQYELARFKTNSSGIIDFQDMRTFLDFDSIYGAIQKEYRTLLEQLKQELSNVENGSAYLLKNNIAIIGGNITLSNGKGNTQTNYPEGFNCENSVVISIGAMRKAIEKGAFTLEYGHVAQSFIMGAYTNVNNISISAYSPEDIGPSSTVPFKLVLLKLSE